MIRTTLRRVKPWLGRVPFARRIRRLIQANRVCRKPCSGSVVERVRWLGKIEEIGRDRLPNGTNVALLGTWLDQFDRTVGIHPPTHPHRLLLFSTMAHWVEFCLPLALSLAGRGCLVDYAWVPYSLLDRDLDPRDERHVPARRRPWYLPSSTRLHSRIRLLNLLNVPASAVPVEMRSMVEAVSRLDANYFLRREVIDFQHDPDGVQMAAFRHRRNLDCLSRLLTLFRQNPYDSVLIPNGAVYEFSVAFQAARRFGYRTATFDFGERKGRIFASDGGPCVEADTSKAWAADAPHTLTPEREERVMTFLLRREQPNWQAGDYLWQGQAAAPAEADSLRRQLDLDRDRPVALLCTNIAFDSAVLGQTRAFPSMVEWVLRTVEWFAARPDWQLVVRCHPAEVFMPSNEPVPELIATRFPQLPANVRIVRPGDKVNTYGLMRLCRFGLIYTSTVGLEMAARGVPALVVGKVHYAGKGFTTDPANPREFFEELERFTSHQASPRLTARQVELARCYADVYFFSYQRAFPWWNPGLTEADMAVCPLERILCRECDPAILDTLDFLSGLDGQGTAAA